jgi:hypothetical protein
MHKKVQSLSFLALVVVTMVVSSGCAAHEHVIGSGGQTGEMQTARQWYVLWGLVPINNVDTRAMVGDADDYTIETAITPLDFVINLFTGIVTVYSRSVTVTE